MKVFDVSDRAAGPVTLPGFGTIELVTDDNGQRHEPFLPITGFVMHWTADTNRMRVYAAYHWAIADNGSEAAIIRTLHPSEKGQHLWGRNTGIGGAAYCATADSELAGYGPGAPTARQREAMQILGAEFCAWHHIDPRGHLALPKKASDASSIWTVPGQVTAPTVASHQTFAALDGYAAERWDTGALLPPDRAAIQALYDDLKAGRRHFVLTSLL